MQKYKFGKETKTLDDGRVLHRIIAVKNFGNVREGMLGGFIEDTQNLSQKGDSWVSGNAIAAGYSRITGNAILRDSAFADEYAKVTDDAVIEGNAKLLEDCFVYQRGRVGGNTILSGACTICGSAIVRCQSRRSVSGKTVLPNVSGLAIVRENAVLEGKVCIQDRCVIEGNATISGNARLTADVYVGGFATVENKASLSDNVKIFGHARICGNSKICGNVVVTDDAIVCGKSLIVCNVIVSGNAVLENAILSGDTRCSYAITNARRLMPSTVICERKKEIPASSLRPAAANHTSSRQFAKTL